MDRRILFLILILTLFCGGCATLVNIDRLPAGTKKGYVEFQKTGKDINLEIFEYFPEEHSLKFVDAFVWSKIIRLAAVPGIHRYFFSAGETADVNRIFESDPNIMVDVSKDMVTYIVICVGEKRMGRTSRSVYYHGVYESQEILYDASICNTGTVSLEEANQNIERIKNKKE